MSVACNSTRNIPNLQFGAINCFFQLLDLRFKMPAVLVAQCRHWIDSRHTNVSPSKTDFYCRSIEAGSMRKTTSALVESPPSKDVIKSKQHFVCGNEDDRCDTEHFLVSSICVIGEVSDGNSTISRTSLAHATTRPTAHGYQ